MTDTVKGPAAATAQPLRKSDPATSEITSENNASLQPTQDAIRVVDGSADLGHLRRRLWTGQHAIEFEAFGLDNKSIGLFPTEKEAAHALWRHAHGAAP
jgi:hypothetical protein